MKQDIKKDTLKNQLDDALRQSYNPTLMINPELAVVQLNTIMDEQCIKFLDWKEENNWHYVRINNKYGSVINGLWVMSTTSELLQIFKKEQGL